MCAESLECSYSITVEKKLFFPIFLGDMYPRGGQTGGGGGISSTNTGVMAPASGPANNTTKTGSDYSGGYGTGYGEFDLLPVSIDLQFRLTCSLYIPFPKATIQTIKIHRTAHDQPTAMIIPISINHSRRESRCSTILTNSIIIAFTSASSFLYLFRKKTHTHYINNN